ncbi:MAG: hypothetical protein V3W18_00015 [candidate division Zixibacteria bacterium]
MAKILSQIATVIRGSIGGITFLANSSQSIVARARVSPVNPSTQAQTDIRTGFSFANQRWQDMDQAERDGWEDYADSLVYTGPTGTYDVPGRQVWLGNASFLQFLNNSGLATITVIDTPPVTTGFAKFDLIQAVDPGVPGVGFDLNLLQSTGDDMDVLINISLGFNPSRNRFKGPWADAQTRYIQLASGVTANIPIEPLVDGLAYFFRIRGVTNSAGHRGTAAFVGRHIAATNP